MAMLNMYGGSDCGSNVGAGVEGYKLVIWMQFQMLIIIGVA